MDGQGAKKEEVLSIKPVSGGPYEEVFQEPELSANAGPDTRKFEVRCHAGKSGHLQVATDAVSVRIGQRLRRKGKDEFWGSLLVECKEQSDGSLAVEVVIFHPDWDEPLRIASIQSTRGDKNGREQTLLCDLEHKHL